MASGTNLRLIFEGTHGDAVFVYPYVNSEVDSLSVKALMQGMITNGSVFTNPLVTKKSATIITNRETAINIED